MKAVVFERHVILLIFTLVCAPMVDEESAAAVAAAAEAVKKARICLINS